MNDVERELRDMLERKARLVGGVAPRLPKAVRKRGRRRQAGTAMLGVFTVAAVALVSFAGVRAIDRGAENTRIPGGEQSNRYKVFERTATIETLTITSPSDWYLVNQWPMGAQVATSTSSGTSCTAAVAPGESGPPVEACEGGSSLTQAPVIDPSPVPMLLLSDADLGLGTSPCLEGGLDLAGSTAVLEVAVDIEGVQGIQTGTGPELPAWPVAFDEDTVSDGPCGQGHYARFQAGPYPYIAWIGFGPEASDDVRRSLFDMANGLQIEDVELQRPSDETPGYVIAGGENAAGPWRLELRPSTSEGPDANIDLHLIGSEGEGPGMADFTVPDATPIESGGGDPTFGVVTKEASGVELHLEEGTPPIPATIIPLPPTLAFPFDLFFAENAADVQATAFPLGLDEATPAAPSTTAGASVTPSRDDEVTIVGTSLGTGWELKMSGGLGAEGSACIDFDTKGEFVPLCLGELPVDQPLVRIWSDSGRLFAVGSAPAEVVGVRFESSAATSTTGECGPGPSGWNGLVGCVVPLFGLGDGSIVFSGDEGELSIPLDEITRQLPWNNDGGALIATGEADSWRVEQLYYRDGLRVDVGGRIQSIDQPALQEPIVLSFPDYAHNALLLVLTDTSVDQVDVASEGRWFGRWMPSSTRDGREARLWIVELPGAGGGGLSFDGRSVGGVTWP